MSPYQLGVHFAAEEARKAARRCLAHAENHHAHQKSYFIGAAVALAELAAALDPPTTTPGEPPPTTPSPGPPQGATEEARLRGYVGDACPDCGNFTLARNGACLKCDTCGATTGCS